MHGIKLDTSREGGTGGTKRKTSIRIPVESESGTKSIGAVFVIGENRSDRCCLGVSCKWNPSRMLWDVIFGLPGTEGGRAGAGTTLTQPARTPRRPARACAPPCSSVPAGTSLVLPADLPRFRTGVLHPVEVDGAGGGRGGVEQDPTDGPTRGRMGRQTDRTMDGRTDGRAGRHRQVQTDKRYRETEKQRDRETDRQADRRTDGRTDGRGPKSKEASSGRGSMSYFTTPFRQDFFYIIPVVCSRGVSLAILHIYTALLPPCRLAWGGGGKRNDRRLEYC